MDAPFPGGLVQFLGLSRSRGAAFPGRRGLWCGMVRDGRNEDGAILRLRISGPLPQSDQGPLHASGAAKMKRAIDARNRAGDEDGEEDHRAINRTRMDRRAFHGEGARGARRPHFQQEMFRSAWLGPGDAISKACGRPVPSPTQLPSFFSSVFQRSQDASRALRLASEASGASPARMKPWPAPG